MSKEIYLTQGYKAIIDNEDYKMVRQYKWWVMTQRGKRPRAITNVNRRTTLLSRLITNAPKGTAVDHINHNTLDDRKVNLRICTNSQNMMNVPKIITKKNSSLYKGVCPTVYNTWYARIKVNRKTHYLGCFKTELGAACAYNLAARKYFGEFAMLNTLAGAKALKKGAER